MTALVATRRAAVARPLKKALDRLGRSILILYWSAGLLLILPFALGFWALRTLALAVTRRRARDAHEPGRTLDARR